MTKSEAIILLPVSDNYCIFVSENDW